MRTRRNSSGLSLLEVVLAITVFAVAVPILFGIFFANVEIEKELAIKNELPWTANDLKGFLKIADYDGVYTYAKSGQLLVVSEEEQDEIAMRRFLPADPDTKQKIMYACKIRILGDKPEKIVEDSSALSLWCEVFCLNRNISWREINAALDSCKIRYAFPYVKNR